ncbi:hypothetical protein IJI69_02325 [Candidatus Saccharibacteria bacterium]|nr:hypothetical protein [Candidatus Saccharibacteria bacterium]MBQ9403300.1 hypothetical protein [Candidatus Saccharibacteria bacterium]
MFFDDELKIEQIASLSGFSIFVMPTIPDILPKTGDKNHLVVQPIQNSITIEQVREIINQTKVKQTKDFYIFVYNAEKMNEKAENAFLKLLEEPADNYHFVLFTNSASALLPTILSRGDLYIKRIKNPLNTPVDAPEMAKLYAKRIISAKNSDLPNLIKDLSNEKDFKKDARFTSLQITETAIEILYKSYFATKNPAFLKKLPKLLTLHDNLKQNGHIKLHLIADLC